MKVLVAGDFAPVARLVKQIEEKRFSEVFLIIYAILSNRPTSRSLILRAL